MLMSFDRTGICLEVVSKQVSNIIVLEQLVFSVLMIITKQRLLFLVVLCQFFCSFPKSFSILMELDDLDFLDF